MKKRPTQFVVTEVFHAGGPAERRASVSRMVEKYLSIKLRP